jgi:ubiquinol oxidase
VALSYYKTGDPYLFDDFQMRPPGSRRPPCDNLLDVFENISKDEVEHVKTMQACQDYALLGKKVMSSHARFPDAEPDAKSKRVLWNEWSEEMNSEPSDE